MGTATFLGAHGRFRDPNPKPNSAVPRRRRQRLPAESSPLACRRGGAPATSSSANKNLVMGQVKILKRGEPLVPAAATAMRRKPDADLALGSTNRLGPEPELVSFQIRVKELKMAVDGSYAGSGFVASPPPSSVPVPGFLRRK